VTDPLTAAAAALAAAVFVAGLLVFAVYAARTERRVGRWGRMLPLPKKGGACLRCSTDFAFVRPHDTPYHYDGRCCFPLCEPCWKETTPDERIVFYARMLLDWRAAGKYDGDEAGWDEDREAIFAAVKAGL
jgi:hypothetical protein